MKGQGRMGQTRRDGREDIEAYNGDTVCQSDMTRTGVRVSGNARECLGMKRAVFGIIWGRSLGG